MTELCIPVSILAKVKSEAHVPTKAAPIPVYHLVVKSAQ